MLPSSRNPAMISQLMTKIQILLLLTMAMMKHLLKVRSFYWRISVNLKSVVTPNSIFLQIIFETVWKERKIEIFLTKNKVALKTCNGTISDSASQTTMIGLNKEKEYCQYMHTNLKAIKTMITIRSKKDQQSLLGSMGISIPILGHRMTTDRVHIFKADVPILISLDFLGKYNLYVNSVENCLCSTTLIPKISPAQKHGPSYLESSKNDTTAYKEWSI